MRVAVHHRQDIQWLYPIAVLAGISLQAGLPLSDRFVIANMLIREFVSKNKESC
jgi:hypothetical protein